MAYWNRIQMRRWATALANALQPGDVISLVGELGAGKTQTVQWIGEALGVDAEITSPTFSIVRHYKGRDFAINHIDLYRLSVPEELEAIDYETLLYPEDAVTLVEWASRAAEYMPRGMVEIEIIKGDGDLREIRWCATDARSCALRKATEERRTCE